MYAVWQPIYNRLNIFAHLYVLGSLSFLTISSDESTEPIMILYKL